MNSPTYSLYVEYPFIKDFSEIDKDIEESLGQKRVASGAGAGIRDLEFEFSSVAAVKHAKDTVRFVLEQWFSQEKISVYYCETWRYIPNA